MILLQELGIIISLGLLIFLAYRGYSVLYIAPILAILACVTQGISPLPGYSELFLGKAIGYFKSYFPVFLLGAMFGKVFEETGLAESVARSIIRATGSGKMKAVVAVTAAGIVLTYGGVNAMVAVFAVYPFGAAVFREMDIPKRLLPAVIILAIGTVSMDAFPGAPQVANIIPTRYFGTDIFAAPVTGMMASVLILAFGFWWFNHQIKKAEKHGEGYGNHVLNEPDLTLTRKLVDWKLAVIPLISVLIINFSLSKFFPWNQDMLTPFHEMGLPLVSATVNNVVAIWAIIIADCIAIGLAILIGYNSLKTHSSVQRALNAGAIGSLVAVMNVTTEVGYGNVIAALPGFKSIANFFMGIQLGNAPLLSEAVTVNILAGITGSASGGLGIALDIMGEKWLEMADAIGMSPEVLHRIASLASGGMDDLPHNGAVITILMVCGLTHKQGYKDIFALVVGKTSVAFIMAIFCTFVAIV